MSGQEKLGESKEFSLVLGGPLYQLCRKTHLCGSVLEEVRRRIIAFVCITWVPLLILSAIEGRAFGGTLKIPFIYDVETHVRLLVSLPILIWAELIVHLRIRPAVQTFVERQIIRPADMPKFETAIQSTLRIRNSVFLEILIIAFVYTVGWIWRSHFTLSGETWLASPNETGHNFTYAGYWAIFVSVPFFQFIFLRWFMRFALWFYFLWRVSRLDLDLVLTHADKAGGLGFLGRSTYAFGPILFAQGAVLSGIMASQIFYEGKGLQDFKVQIAVCVAVLVSTVLVPLFLFVTHLARARRAGSSEFGKVSTRYSREFEQKWFKGGAPADEALMGSADLQSLADLGNSYASVQEMRMIPFGLKDVSLLAGYVLVPILPLLLTIFTVEELINQVVKILF